MDISVALLLAALTCHGADWAQTHNISHHSGMREMNRLLGEKPSSRTINRYFAATAAVGIALYALSDDRKKPAIALIWLGVGAGSVVNNYRAGLRINF